MKLSDGLFLESCRRSRPTTRGRSSSRTASSTTCACSSSRSRTCTTSSCLPNLYGDIVSDLAAGSSAAWASRRARTSARGGGLRAGPRLGAQVRRAEQGEPDGADPESGADAAPPRLPGGADRVEAAVRDVIAEGATTYDLGGTAGTREPSPTRSSSGSSPARAPGAPLDDRIAGRLARARASRRAPPRRLRHDARRDRGGPRRSSRGRCSRSARLLWFSGILLTPLFGTPYEAEGLPVAPVLAAGRPRVAADVDQSGLCHLWIPLGFRATCYYYRKAYYRFYFADPPAARSGSRRSTAATGSRRAFPFILQNLPPDLPVPRLRPAFLPVGGRGAVAPGRRASGGSGSGRRSCSSTRPAVGYSLSCHSLRTSSAADRLLLVHRRRQDRYTLWQRLTSLNRNHMAWGVDQPHLGDARRRVCPGAGVGLITDPASTSDRRRDSR
jgi:hypothetical protein